MTLMPSLSPSLPVQLNPALFAHLTNTTSLMTILCVYLPV